MKYVSTRGKAPNLGFEQVLIAGLATDGGLYVPEKWPKFSQGDLMKLQNLSYQEVAFHVMKPFIGEAFSSSEFKDIIHTAYSSFSHSAICPIKQLSNNHFLLELFHGPTLAFKDVAMQLIGEMFGSILGRNNRRSTIIAATSGDTGSAAMEAFCRNPHADVFILFPHGRVSDVQRLQMTTLGKKNIFALAVDGDFDDCQALVKGLFSNLDFRNSVGLTGVNSINWARVLAQTVYYFTSAVSLGAPKRAISFTVPTGNFGDIFAGYVALKMGLPIDRLVIATNENDILHRALHTGLYSKRRIIRTSSPSMDIQVSSNFERLLYDLGDKDGFKISDLMTRLNEKGEFPIGEESLNKMKNYFSSVSVSEQDTKNTIQYVLNKTGQLVCPHTAVGIKSGQTYLSSRGKVPMVTLATAHPGKFPDVVEQATQIRPMLPKKYLNLFSKKETIFRVKNSLSEIEKFISERVNS